MSMRVYLPKSNTVSWYTCITKKQENGTTFCTVGKKWKNSAINNVCTLYEQLHYYLCTSKGKIKSIFFLLFSLRPMLLFWVCCIKKDFKNVDFNLRDPKLNFFQILTALCSAHSARSCNRTPRKLIFFMTLSGESLGKKTTTTLAQILQNLFLDNEVERKNFFFF